MKVAVLDSFPISRKRLTIDLDNCDVKNVIQAENEADTMKYLEQAMKSSEPVHTVFVSWDTHKGHAPKLIEQIKSDKRFKDLQIVSVIREPTEDNVKDAINHGASAVLARPVDIKKLRKLVSD